MGKTIYYKDNTLSFTVRLGAENTVFCRRIRGVRVPYYFYLLAEAENSSNFLGAVWDLPYSAFSFEFVQRM